MRRPVVNGCLLIVLAARLGAQASTDEPHHHGSVVGTVHFPVTGTRAAAQSFDRGVALLHSFEYVDAATAFRAAEKQDPTLALAHYGEALTFRHSLWGEEKLDSARTALSRFGSSPSERLTRVPAGRERAFAAAVEALFVDAPEPIRARAFADSMRSVVAQYPVDPEAKAFAAIAMLGAAVYIRDSTGLKMRLDAASLAEQVLAANPDHPGAAHYIIHAYDTPALAARGLGAAQRYASIAPSSGHALHMPAHIFLQVGRWKDVERANVASNASAQRWVRSHGLGAESRDFHALDWLGYSLVQQGRLREARVVLDTIAALVTQAKTFTVDDMETTDLGEIFSIYFAWDGGIRGAINAPRPAAFNRFVATPAAGSASAPLWAFLAKALAASWSRDTVTSSRSARAMHAFADTNTTGRVRYYRMFAQELDGLALATRGDTAGAITSLTQTADQARTMPFWSGPFWGAPPGELLAELLLASGRNGEAVEAFTRALALRQNAAAPLLGRARALWAAGDHARAQKDYQQLAQNWAHADRDLPALGEVRTRSSTSH